MSGSAHVFISYSSKDADIVERLKQALTDAGVRVWLDHERLTPGTPNWQIAIRQGIGQATAVVYVASETASISPYVIDEISLARGKGKPVVPFWARGEAWHDCAPLGWGLTQYADGRGSSYASGLATLLHTLGLSAPAVPLKPTYALPDVPPRLSRLGFRGVNPKGTPAILPPLVSVSAGPFLMGSDKARDSRARDDEIPQHRVELVAFQIGKYPVTVAEFALGVRAGAVREPPELKSARVLGVKFSGMTWQTQLQRLDHPVVCISWQEATAYISWLREVTGQRGWRLPSEAEWEKAARWDFARGISRLYPWGDSFDKNRCNTYSSGIGRTTPVGSYPASDARQSGASPWGAEDMAGNVWEWTSSLFKSYPYMSTDGRENQDSTDKRTLHGGSWGLLDSDARVASRDHVMSGGFNDTIGFRLVL